jgi:hypothetical protein
MGSLAYNSIGLGEVAFARWIWAFAYVLLVAGRFISRI